MFMSQRRQSRRKQPIVATAPMRRPGAVGIEADSHVAFKDASSSPSTVHALCDTTDNQRLFDYEKRVKDTFDRIEPMLQQVMDLPRDANFEAQAQTIAKQQLGFGLPENILGDSSTGSTEKARLFSWCVFESYRKFCEDFFSEDPLAARAGDDFQSFLQSCGFHLMDITPCADGRLAHIIRYVLRLPQRHVRRKSFAGAMFDIDDSVQKWVEVEMLRHHEASPNAADEPTRYLKIVAYHFSSVDPHHEGCAAHGSDTRKAASAGLAQLQGFREAVENSFCCGASIDLLLIGIDTDTDAMRVHVPDGHGEIDLDRFVDSLELFQMTQQHDAAKARQLIADAVVACAADIAAGMQRFIARIIENNLSQIEYVQHYYGQAYPDTGHAERFIGCGVGFEEIQLRNLMYFAYLNTVEEAAADLDVGIKIFSGLNVSRDLPVPIVVRFDYHGHVPGARERSIAHCRRVAEAINNRYGDLLQQGLLHILQVIRDCRADASLEVLQCSVNDQIAAGVH